MSDLAKWLSEQEARFSPFFSASAGPRVKEHVVGLLVVHAATCEKYFDKAPFFLEGLLGMYRINRDSPFSLPVEGWAKIRRAQQLGMADELHIDVCDGAYLIDPLRPIPDETLVESLRTLTQAVPIVDSLPASDAIADWCRPARTKETSVPCLDANNLRSFRITIDESDQGRSALSVFWAIAGAYTRLSSSIENDIRSRSSEQLSFADNEIAPLTIPADLPDWILSRHLRVIEHSLYDAYFARCRLYLACLEWYRRKMMAPKPMGSVSAAVTCSEAAHSAVEA